MCRSVTRNGNGITKLTTASQLLVWRLGLNEISGEITVYGDHVPHDDKAISLETHNRVFDDISAVAKSDIKANHDKLAMVTNSGWS